MSTVTALSNVADGRRMKADLQDLRRRGAIRTSECSLGESGVRSCSLCRAGLGWIVNRGAVCQACRKRVCKACREYAVRTVDWVCTVCYKRTQLQTATGEWMNEFIKKPKQWKDSKFSLSPAEIIKSTIRRSWTICDPNPRWSSSRDSSEFRPYNSLPRGRDVTDYPSLLSQRSVQTSGQSIDTIPSTEKLSETDKEGGFSVSPRQRRVSQFERTLSELYGTKKNSAARKMSTSDENGLDKTSTEDDNFSSTSSNGIETKKIEIKPSKIPARKKVQYTRSETSAISSPKQPLRKQTSLQPSRKQKDRTLDDTKEEKHVSFDYETTKKIDDLHSSPKLETKSNIPKSKSRNSSRTDSTSTTRSSISGDTDTRDKNLLNNNEITSSETKCDINNLNRAQNEDGSKETEKTEEPITGSLFRKVTIKKRRHDFRKTQAFDEGRRKHRCSNAESTEFIDCETGKILLPEGDDYKLVFISSDSSSKEEDVDDNDSVSSSSATTAHSFTIDDCDWDYFEPSSGVRQVLCWSNRNSPFGSPRVYRRGILESPLGSPLVYRRTRTRTRESDTGTDEDVTTRGIDSGSPVSSDSTAGFLSRMRSPSDTEDHLAMDATSIYVDHQTKHQQLQCVMHRDESTTCGSNNTNGNAGLVGSALPCHNCGAIAQTPAPTTQFVPIPVLVPIPVPVPTIWNPLDSVILYNTSDTLDGNLRARLRAIQQRAAGTFLWPYVNQASLISQLISSGVTATDANTLLSVYNSTATEAGTTTDVCKSETATSMPRTASERNNNNATTQTDNIENTITRSDDANAVPSTAAVTVNSSLSSSSSSNAADIISINSNRETEGESNRDDDPDNSSTRETRNDDKCKVILLSAPSMAPDTELSLPTELPLAGYLASENTYMSSSESSDSSDSEDEGVGKPKVRRTYNVNGGNIRDSDDALPSSDVSSDCDDDDDDDDEKDRMSHSSERNDDLSSSGTDDTDSDDTGTVADQKSKKFYKVFVVNTNDSSSDIEDNTDSSSDTDTSDNDTDTEKDCIVLNYMRTFDDDSIDNKNNPVDENIEPVVLLKHRKSVENDESLQNKKMCEEIAVDNGIVLLKHSILKNDSDLSETDSSICVNDSISPKSNALTCNEANNVDNGSVLLDKNESDTTITECQHIDLNSVEKKYEDNYKWQGNTDVASSLDQNRIDASVTSISTRNAELIGEIRVASEHVSVENKQSTNDLETTASPSDIQQANDPCTTSTEIDIVDDDTPLRASVNETSNCILASNDANIAQNKSVDVESAKVFPQEEKLMVVGSEKHVAEVRSERDNGSGSEWNMNTSASAGIRSSDPVRWPPVESGGRNVRGVRTGVPAVATVDTEPATRHVPGAPAARYTSLVMITQEPPAPAPRTIYPQVSVVPSVTTTIIPSTDNDNDVIVQHTNWQNNETTTNITEEPLASDTCALALDSEATKHRTATPRKPVLVTTNSSANHNETVTVLTGSETLVLADSDPASHVRDVINGVTVVTGADTLSAVVCLEEGLADDDSWVEDISHDEDEFATTTATDSSSGEEVMLSCTSVLDQEEELRGYHRSAIDFTLHTIVEESCEESEVEQSQINNKKRPTSATDLEKYFFFRLGDGTVPNVNEDAFSETSSIYSEGMDSLSTAEEQNNDGGDPAELASSRLEKYFLSGFMGFTAERRDSDGSVGSDSEGRPSPEQRRKKLVRARGTGRSHSSSLDNLLANAELSGTEPQLNDAQQLVSEDSSSSETDTYDDSTSNFEKSDGQFDTVKRKKCKKQRVISGGSSSPHEEKKGLEITVEEGSENKDSDVDDDGHKTPQPEFLLPMSVDLANSRKQQSRDSGFIGSCDDLLKEQKSSTDSISNSNDSSPSLKKELKNDLEKITEEKRATDEKIDKLHNSVPPTTTLTRKDSFNNWSSDEETNLMMSKMRQFFKTMVANSANANLNSPSKPTTPIMSKQNSPRPVPSPRTKNRNKPPQLVYFENELTRLMKTVPGIRDDQVREIVEYLSSEDTWSDSYDSSDYTSSDLEGTAVAQKSVLQEQISASCQQIIKKFDKTGAGDEEGDEGDGGILDESQGLNRETAFVYQKLVASFNKMTTGDINKQISPHNSPPLIAKVMHHIGSRLVALMHEVSSGESHCSNSPKARYYHRRLQQKLSSASSTTTEDDDSTSDSNLPDRLTALEDLSHSNILPRSRSHDLLLGEARPHHHSSSGVSDIAEEREASDYERFSWRGSFESALMATDSRTRLSQIGTEGSASASALAMAAKRRSAGDLLFSPKSLSREQLDRVRSCGSIGGSGNSEEKHWVVSSAVRPNRRRSSVPDATCGSGGSADGEDDDDEDIEGRSTLPRSLQTNANTTNSLPRLPTSANAANMQKAHSMHHFLQHNVKSARYRPPGFNRSIAGAGPKRAVSAPGLQPSHPRRDARRRSQQPSVTSDDISTTESNSSPVVGPKSGSKSASPSPIHGNTLTRGSGSISSADCQGNDDDIDRLVAMHHNRNSLSSLGLRSDSMASVYSGAGEGRYGIVAVRGQVEFGLQYNYKAGALEICVKQCKDLAAVDQKRNRSDPYVKVYLLPDKSKSGKRKTKVKKHTLNPVFDETLKFHLSLSGLETRTLWLTVWHSDMFGRNDFLGEVMMPLENKVFDDPTPKWYNLQERTEPFEELPSYKGDVIIGLKFVPPDMTIHKKGKRSRGALHVLVKEAKSLTAVKANGTSDPFCKSYLLPDKGRSNKQKTPILRRTTNPVWNHTFIYDDVTLQELAERALELTVWDHDRLASNEFLGGVRFSLGTNKHYGKNVDWMDATGKELSLWQSMLERPNFWVEGCVTLRSSLDNRCS